MKILIDTNVLLRAVQKDHLMHDRAVSAMAAHRAEGEQLCVISQNLIEFWAVATRPIPNNGLGLTIQEAQQEILNIKLLFALHHDVTRIFKNWEHLVTKYQVQGKQAHDARIVAEMIAHDIKNILTFNIDDFKRYTEITAILPLIVTT